MPLDKPDVDLATVHVPDRHRYEVAIDDDPVGFTAYVDRDGQRIFFHTEIDDQFGGRGLAGRLVAHALTDTRAAGRRIVAVCPYVAKYLKTHHEVDDVLDPVTPAALAAVREAKG